MNRETLEKLAGVHVSRETFARLEGFESDFNAWAARINLVAPSTRNEFWERHVADSLQVLAVHQGARSWVDLGSGGGFPGLVIAIALADDHDSRVTLVESNRKKCSFLQMMKSKYAPRSIIVPARIEDALDEISQPDIVTARALAELNTLFQMTQNWLASGTIGLFLKGRGYGGEIEKSRANWAFDLVVYNSKTASDAVVLQVSKLEVIT